MDDTGELEQIADEMRRLDVEERRRLEQEERHRISRLLKAPKKSRKLDEFEDERDR